MKISKIFYWVTYSFLCLALTACGGGENGSNSGDGGSGGGGDVNISTLAVSKITPTTGATNITVMPSIQLQFNAAAKNVNATNVTLRKGSVNGSTVTIGSITASTDNTSYTFSPAAFLDYSSVYYVVLSNGITNSDASQQLATTSFSFTTATPFAKQVGPNAFGNGISTDSDRNSYVVGGIGSNYFIAKYGPNGDIQWSRQVGDSGDTTGWGIKHDSAGNSYITGVTTVGISNQTQNGNSDYFIAKYDPNGTLLWSKQVGVAVGDTGSNGISIDSAGNSYIIGSTNAKLSDQVKNGNLNYFIVKYDSSGNLIWSRQVGAAGGATEGYGISTDSAGNSYITGYTDVGISGQAQIGNADYFIAKYDSSGNLIWSRQVGTAGGTTEGYGISTDSAGNSYITGYTDVGISQQTKNGQYDYFIAKYDSNGNFKWSKQVGAAGGTTVGVGISTDSVGNSYLTGFTNVGISGQTKQGSSDFFTAKYSPDGNLLWTSQVGAAGKSVAGYGISIDSGGNTYVTGETNFGLFGQTSSGGFDYFIVKR